MVLFFQRKTLFIDSEIRPVMATYRGEYIQLIRIEILG